MSKMLIAAAATALTGSMLCGCVAYGPGYDSPGYVAQPTASVVIGWHGDNYWDGHRYWSRQDWESRHPEQRGGGGGRPDDHRQDRGQNRGQGHDDRGHDNRDNHQQGY